MQTPGPVGERAAHWASVVQGPQVLLAPQIGEVAVGQWSLLVQATQRPAVQPLETGDLASH
jgi:hypothetical protein